MNYTCTYIIKVHVLNNLNNLQGSIKIFLCMTCNINTCRSTVKFDKQARGPKFIKSVTVKQFMLFLKCLYQTWVLLFKRGDCDV